MAEAVPPGADRVCIHCGKVVDPRRERYCNHCGELFAAPGDPYEALLASKPASVVRTYRGKQQTDAVGAFQREATILADRGYVPSSQSWAAGQWGCGAFLVALLLAIVLIGILIFIYLLIVKPEGTLTVTYVRQTTEAGAPADASELTPTTSLTDRLAQLDTALEAGLITPEEHAAKRASVLESF